MRHGLGRAYWGVIRLAADNRNAVLRREGVTLTHGDVAQWVECKGGLADQATEYLNSIAPESYYFEWDFGELGCRVR